VRLQRKPPLRPKPLYSTVTWLQQAAIAATARVHSGTADELGLAQLGAASSSPLYACRWSALFQCLPSRLQPSPTAQAPSLTPWPSCTWCFKEGDADLLWSSPNPSRRLPGLRPPLPAPLIPLFLQDSRRIISARLARARLGLRHLGYSCPNMIILQPQHVDFSSILCRIKLTTAACWSAGDV
jgi:hypothetical protein